MAVSSEVAVHAADRLRRWIRWGAVLGIAMTAWLVPPASGAERVGSGNRLEGPMADLAILEATGRDDGEATPLLLVLSADLLDSDGARLSVLRRGRDWDSVADGEIRLGRGDLSERWLVGLGEDRFALIATTPRSTPGDGAAVVVGFEVASDGSAPPKIVELGRSRVDRAIESAGAPDVDGLGAAEVAVGLRPVFDVAGACGSSSVMVLDGGSFAVRRSFEVPGRIGAGALGRWDAEPGDDLLAYASVDCPPGSVGATRLLTLRLSDGTRSTVAEMEAGRDVQGFPPPLRLRLGGDPRDRALATIDDVSIVDASGRPPQRLGSLFGTPLAVGPDAGDRGAGTIIAWMDHHGVHAARVRAGVDDTVTQVGRSDLDGDAVGQGRWDLARSAAAADVRSHGLSSAWVGGVLDAACPDLLLPGAILPCDGDQLRPGATWLATRPIAAMPIEGRRALLIAAGVEWLPETGLPEAPSPWAGGPQGWWRQGPSAGFAVSETRANDVVYFQDFPVPRATIEPSTGRDGTTLLPGFTGTRLFVTVTPLRGDAAGPDIAPTPRLGLVEPPAAGGVTRVLRVPVEPGNESGRDGSFTTLSLADVRLRGADPTTRWAVRVVPINDWGEVGFPVVRTIVRDADGPTLNLETPFTSPVWPFQATLPGRAEPGSTVSLEGQGDVPVDRRGRFSVVTRLAPWPQTLRLTATDPNGNSSVGEFSVVGGVDYRLFPWPLIGAVTLLALVTGRGLVAAGRGRTGVEATPWSTGLLDEASRPEIEELPPGSGLARS